LAANLSDQSSAIMWKLVGHSWQEWCIAKRSRPKWRLTDWHFQNVRKALHTDSEKSDVRYYLKT